MKYHIDFNESNYIDRTKIQSRIAKYLIGESKVKTLQVVGVGGIGKTTTIYKSLIDTGLSEYCHWVICNSDNIEDEIRKIEKAHKNLSYDPIIIFDEIHNRNIEETNLYVNHFLANYRHPKLILVSRDTFNRIDSDFIHIEPLNIFESLLLIATKDQTRSDAIQLHEISQGNPLAIKLLTEGSETWDLESIKNLISFKKEIQHYSTPQNSDH